MINMGLVNLSCFFSVILLDVTITTFRFQSTLEAQQKEEINGVGKFQIKLVLIQVFSRIIKNFTEKWLLQECVHTVVCQVLSHWEYYSIHGQLVIKFIVKITT